MLTIVIDRNPWQGGIGTYGQAITARLEARNDTCVLRHREFPRIRPTNPIRPALLSLPGSARKGLPLWTPGFIPPLRWNGPCVVTVHDLFYLNRELGHGNARYLFFKSYIVPRLRRVAAIITSSSESADEIASMTGSHGPNIVVAPCGVNDEYFEAGRARLKGHGDGGVLRLIYVGSYMKYKRVDKLLTALLGWRGPGRIELSLPESPPEYLAELASRLPTTVAIRWRQPMPTQALAGEVAASDVLVLLSEAEGFGLPPLEAQACGTATLVSDFKGARARYGADGSYFLETDASATDVLRALEELASSDELRRSLSSAGLQNAQNWTWGASAEIVRAALADAAHQ